MSRHTYECHVRFSDVDVYGHVNNVKYFEYYQEARIAFVLSLSGDGFDATVLDAPGGRPHRRRLQAADPVPARAVRRRDLGDPDRHLVVRPGRRIVDAERDTLYSDAEVSLVAFDTGTQRSRPLTDAERSRLEAVPGLEA